MPPAIPFPTVRARSLSNVLDDLREARRDYDDAMVVLAFEHAHDFHDDETQDRCAEAETRLEDLRDEANALLLDATGLTFEALLAAREGCLL
jgi:hypothetical protein